MNLVDFIEAWWLSVQPIFETAGAISRFERSPIDRLNSSCALNIRRDKQEADLLVWASGEAEFTTIGRDGSANQQHFDDLHTPSALGMILLRCIHVAVSSESGELCRNLGDGGGTGLR